MIKIANAKNYVEDIQIVSPEGFDLLIGKQIF